MSPARKKKATSSRHALAKRAATPHARAASISSVAMSRHDPVASAKVWAGDWVPFSVRRW